MCKVAAIDIAVKKQDVMNWRVNKGNLGRWQLRQVLKDKQEVRWENVVQAKMFGKSRRWGRRKELEHLEPWRT